MKSFLASRRLALFAPFIALGVLALIAFAAWHFIVDRISTELAAQGMRWQSLEREGFPARISLYLEEPRWQGTGEQAGLAWQNERLSLTVMPFKGGHAIMDFRGAHELTGPKGQLRLAHQGNLMSAVIDANGLNRASFDAKAPYINARWNGLDMSARAANLELHMRRAASERKSERIDAALITRQVSVTVENNRLALARVDISASLPAAIMERPLAAGDVIMLERAIAQRNGLSLVAKGRLKLRGTGYIDGSLDLDIVNINAFADALVEFGLIARRDKQKLLLLGGLGAALGGDTTDRLSLPLQFKNKRSYLGGVKLGRAPRWR